MNPWDICSIYDLQYFNCPSCVFRISSKQEFINHAYEIHPDAIDYLIKINDNSLSDVFCPWSEISLKIKIEEPDEYARKEISKSISSITYKIENTGGNPDDENIKLDVKTELLDNNFTEIEPEVSFSEGFEDPLNIEMENPYYNCHKCENHFDTKSNLKKHIEITHQGRHKCDQCEKIFSLPMNLKRHIKNVHEGRKDYICNDCGKSFIQSTDLNRHIRTVHEGFRDHACDLCGKTFITSVNLKTHIRTIHEG